MKELTREQTEVFNSYANELIEMLDAAGYQAPYALSVRGTWSPTPAWEYGRGYITWEREPTRGILTGDGEWRPLVDFHVGIYNLVQAFCGEMGIYGVDLDIWRVEL